VCRVLSGSLTALAMFAGQGSAAMADTVLHEALGAPDELTIKGMIRPRVEGIDGQFRPNTAESDFL
jgi:hypothetical protein